LRKEGRKRFFFEKKKQKTFAMGRRALLPPAADRKSFLPHFFSKKRVFASSSAAPFGHQTFLMFGARRLKHQKQRGVMPKSARLRSHSLPYRH
jgi:hypothetical protein